MWSNSINSYYCLLLICYCLTYFSLTLSFNVKQTRRKIKNSNLIKHCLHFRISDHPNSTSSTSTKIEDNQNVVVSNMMTSLSAALSMTSKRESCDRTLYITAGKQVEFVYWFQDDDKSTKTFKCPPCSLTTNQSYWSFNQSIINDSTTTGRDLIASLSNGMLSIEKNQGNYTLLLIDRHKFPRVVTKTVRVCDRLEKPSIDCNVTVAGGTFEAQCVWNVNETKYNNSVELEFGQSCLYNFSNIHYFHFPLAQQKTIATAAATKTNQNSTFYRFCLMTSMCNQLSIDSNSPIIFLLNATSASEPQGVEFNYSVYLTQFYIATEKPRAASIQSDSIRFNISIPKVLLLERQNENKRNIAHFVDIEVNDLAVTLKKNLDKFANFSLKKTIETSVEQRWFDFEIKNLFPNHRYQFVIKYKFDGSKKWSQEFEINAKTKPGFSKATIEVPFIYNLDWERKVMIISWSPIAEEYQCGDNFTYNHQIINRSPAAQNTTNQSSTAVITDFDNMVNDSHITLLIGCENEIGECQSQKSKTKFKFNQTSAVNFFSIYDQHSGSVCIAFDKMVNSNQQSPDQDSQKIVSQYGIISWCINYNQSFFAGNCSAGIDFIKIKWEPNRPGGSLYCSDRDKFGAEYPTFLSSIPSSMVAKQQLGFAWCFDDDDGTTTTPFCLMTSSQSLLITDVASTSASTSTRMQMQFLVHKSLTINSYKTGLIVVRFDANLIPLSLFEHWRIQLLTNEGEIYSKEQSLVEKNEFKINCQQFENKINLVMTNQSSSPTISIVITVTLNRSFIDAIEEKTSFHCFQEYPFNANSKLTADDGSTTTHKIAIIFEKPYFFVPLFIFLAILALLAVWKLKCSQMRKAQTGSCRMWTHFLRRYNTGNNNNNTIDNIITGKNQSKQDQQYGGSRIQPYAESGYLRYYPSEDQLNRSCHPKSPPIDSLPSRRYTGNNNNHYLASTIQKTSMSNFDSFSTSSSPTPSKRHSVLNDVTDSAGGSGGDCDSYVFGGKSISSTPMTIHHHHQHQQQKHRNCCSNDGSCSGCSGSSDSGIETGASSVSSAIKGSTPNNSKSTRPSITSTISSILNKDDISLAEDSVPNFDKSFDLMQSEILEIITHFGPEEEPDYGYKLPMVVTNNNEYVDDDVSLSSMINDKEINNLVRSPSDNYVSHLLKTALFNESDNQLQYIVDKPQPQYELNDKNLHKIDAAANTGTKPTTTATLPKYILHGGQLIRDRISRF